MNRRHRPRTESDFLPPSMADSDVPLRDFASSYLLGSPSLSPGPSQSMDDRSVHRSNSMSDVDRSAYTRSGFFVDPDKNLTAEPEEESGSFVRSDIPVPVRLWGKDEPMHYFIPKTTDPWKKCRVRTDRHDRELYRGWVDDIDTLLVFAGLFSAIVTSFVVETFQWLQEDPGDTTVALLQRISQQLANPNETAANFDDEEFSPDRYVVRVNIFWFLSLAFSLVAALMGILCKQWLYEFRRDAGLSNQNTLALRHMRMLSMEKWRVPSIVSSLPLLLQLGLIFFFIGLMDLLWNMDDLVALLFTLVIGVSLIFVLATSVLPGVVERWYPESLPCAYKSSQAWAFHRVLQWSTQESYPSTADWNVLDQRRMRQKLDDYLVGAIRWIDNKFSKQSMVKHLFHCLQDIEPDVASRCVRSSPEIEADGSIERILLEFLRDHNLDERARNYFVESLLRDINRSASFVEISSELLAVLKEQLPHTKSGWESFPDDLSLQVIDSLRSCVQMDCISPSTLRSLWQINDGFIKHGSEKLRHRALILLQELETWLEKSPTNDERGARALACVEVLLSRKYGNLPQDTARAFALLVETLDAHMQVADIRLGESWLSAGWKELKLMISVAEQPQNARRWSVA